MSANEKGTTTLKVSSVVKVKECLINSGDLPKIPNWRAVFKEAKEQHPGFEPRIVESGELLEGEDSPIAFKGKYLAREYELCLLNVPKSEAIGFVKEWAASNPIGDRTPEAHMRKQRKATNRHFSALVQIADPSLTFSRLQIQYV